MTKPILLQAKEKVPFLNKCLRTQQAGDVLDILEAGCGQRWLLDPGGRKVFLTGVDLDRDALEIRKTVRKDLDEAIHGDLRSISFGDRKFDVIYSAFVLEHIAGAAEVLRRMCGWLRPGGIIVIEIPDPQSVKGLVTRITPHWFHVFYYRRVLGIKTAGKVGYGPYRTYFDRVVSRAGIREFCSENGLSVDAEYAFATDGPRDKSMRTLVGVMTKLIGFCSLGTFSDRHADLLYVLRRQS
jgi:SAM-dependent methyltransferase